MAKSTKKNIIAKIFKTIVFAGPFVAVFLYMFADTLPQQNSLLNHSSIRGVLSLILSCISVYQIWKPKNTAPSTFIKKLLMTLLKVFYYFIWLITVSSFLFLGLFNFKCEACDAKNIRPIISENGVKLNLNEGKELKKYDKEGWQSCRCCKVVSFEKNPEYALTQIESMQNYWTKYENCHKFLNNYKTHANDVNFNSIGPCYTHVQLTENGYKETEIVIVYDKKTNQLFYHYYSP